MTQQQTAAWTPFRDEKLGLKTESLDTESALLSDTSKVSNKAARFFGLVICSLLLCGACFRLAFPGSAPYTIDLSATNAACSQIAPITPTTHASLLKQIDSQYATQAFKLKAYESLGQAVRVPTVMYDDLKPPGEDSRWDVFGDFHTYLEQRFPRVHATLKKTTVNTWALVYHWQGTNDSLKPVLLTAHQDVVPVEPLTLDTWVHPPFSGFYDGEWIWGRGSGDDKSGLVGIMTAIETLLEHDFQPTRSVVLAFGIDEERGGISGATAIGKYLSGTYGNNSFAILVDEGGEYGGQELRKQVVFANPAVAEKGSFNLQIEVSTPGGHSSVPPPHTGIGILANMITELEAYPHETRLLRNTPYYASLQCEAAYDLDLPRDMRTLIIRSQKSEKALSKLNAELLRVNPLFKAITGTTQAVDIIQGGVKINALPEMASAIVNHRIAGHSSVTELQNRIVSILSPVASHYNLSVNAYGKMKGDALTAYGQLVLSDAYGTALEPAPITPTTGSGPWELLSGTIRNTLSTSSRKLYEEKEFVVAPSISLGNTDTKHYWALTKHIFRYGHKGSYDAYNGAHTANEAIRAEGFLEMIRFFTQLILNADETELLE